MKKLKLPSVLSFQRSVEVGRGYFFEKSGIDGELKPLKIFEESITGSFASYKAPKNTAQEMSASNPALIDSAYTSSDCDTFVLKFSVKPIANSLFPNNTNDEQVLIFLNDFVSSYIEKGGMEYLAERYISSIASGSFLFRNLTIADDIQVKVSVDDLSFVFKRNERDTEEFKANVVTLSKVFAEGLKDEAVFKIFEIEASGVVGSGQEVFPSQAFVEKSGSRTSGDKSKTLVSETILFKGNEVRQALMTRGKIGNAIRTIDTWYADDEDLRALPVEPYGIDRMYGTARRFKNNKSLYDLLEGKGVELLKSIKESSSADELSGDIHYCVACLIRGGVLSAEKKKK